MVEILSYSLLSSFASFPIIAIYLRIVFAEGTSSNFLLVLLRFAFWFSLKGILCLLELSVLDGKVTLTILASSWEAQLCKAHSVLKIVPSETRYLCLSAVFLNNFVPLAVSYPRCPPWLQESRKQEISGQPKPQEGTLGYWKRKERTRTPLK